jgi:integrase
VAEQPSKRAKRSSGEGGKGRRKSDGLYYGSVTLPNGDRKYVYAKTAKARDARLLELQIKAAKGEVTPKRQSVAEYLEWWLAEHVEGHLEPSTARGYTSYVHSHIIPALGHRQLAQLSPQHVQSMLNELAKSGLAPRTVQQIRAILRRALHHAQRYDLVGRNVAALTDPPRVHKAKITPYESEQAKQLLEAVRGDRLEALYTVAVALGMREGETFGLKWEDIDWGRAVVHLRRQLVRDPRRKAYVLKVPKSEAGLRDVHLPGFALESLQRHRVRQELEKREAGDGYEDWGLVFCRETGLPLYNRLVLDHLYATQRRVGLPRVRWHDLRHTAAALMALQGASLMEIKETLGHSQISVTADYYGHLYDEGRKAIAERMDAAFRDPDREPGVSPIPESFTVPFISD